jgi:hypothetical protein
VFLGHYGIALAAKRTAPRTSLGALTFAAEFLDELWPILLLLGVEQVQISTQYRSTTPLDFVYYPFSHSLLMSVIWGAVIGGLYFALKGYGRGAWILWALVVSHWFLDLPMHRADLPLWPGGSSPKLGWGLWDSVALTYIIEFSIYLLGVFIYARATRPRDRIGRWGFWAYVVVLAILYVTSNGPPPPSVKALAWTTLGVWLFVPWAWWVDRHRYYTGRVAGPIEG